MERVAVHLMNERKEGRKERRVRMDFMAQAGPDPWAGILAS